MVAGMESVGGVGMDGGTRIGEGEGAWWFGVWNLRGGEPSAYIAEVTIRKSTNFCMEFCGTCTYTYIKAYDL